MEKRQIQAQLSKLLEKRSKLEISEELREQTRRDYVLGTENCMGYNGIAGGCIWLFLSLLPGEMPSLDDNKTCLWIPNTLILAQKVHCCAVITPKKQP